jgi:hypothetical protein
MQLRVDRYQHNEQETFGRFYIDDVYQCYTLEDQHRDVKVKGDTRIPAGTYEVVLRREGGFHLNYSKRFADIHKGMLHVTNVPNFQFILIHVGNTELDTHGCLLVGLTKTGKAIGQSVAAYKKIYPPIAKVLLAGERVLITYNDL